MLIARLGAAVTGSAGATSPRGSNDQARQAFKSKPQDGLVGEGAQQMDSTLVFQTTTCAAIFSKHSQSVSNCATRQDDRAGI